MQMKVRTASITKWQTISRTQISRNSGMNLPAPNVKPQTSMSNSTLANKTLKWTTENRLISWKSNNTRRSKLEGTSTHRKCWRMRLATKNCKLSSKLIMIRIRLCWRRWLESMRRKWNLRIKSTRINLIRRKRRLINMLKLLKYSRRVIKRQWIKLIQMLKLKKMKLRRKMLQT